MGDDADKLVAGADGTPKGWAVVVSKADRSEIRLVTSLSEFIEVTPGLEIFAIDVPIGLLDSYEQGGRACDRAARAFVGKVRASSIFPAPVRGTLYAHSYGEACRVSRASGPNAKALSQQTYAIIAKIREVDELLQSCSYLRDVAREIHPEVCFCEMAGTAMAYSKKKTLGREERRKHLRRYFPDFDAIEKAGRKQRLPTEDIVDAMAACWSALRLATGRGRSLPNIVPFDSKSLPMAIWV